MSLEEIESGARRAFGSLVRVMCLLFGRNSIYTPYFSLHTPLKKHIQENTHLFTLNPNISIYLLLLLLLYLSAPQLPSFSYFVCVLCTQLSSSSGFSFV